MSINVRTKGQEGEREVAKMLNSIVAKVRLKYNQPQYEVRDEIFQRNQNQSAVGGADLSNTLGLEIEVKRQEALSVNTWWKQCVESAARTNGVAILIYRQNRKAWRVMMKGQISITPEARYIEEDYFITDVPVEIKLESFHEWFEAYYELKLREEIARV